MSEEPTRLLDLPEELIQHIWSFVDTNKDSLALALTCKELAAQGRKNGFLKAISYNWKMCLTSSIMGYIAHIDSLKELTINSCEDPHLWFSGDWPHTTRLINCRSDNLSPAESPRLRKLVMIDCQFKKIDFRKIPVLHEKTKKIGQDVFRCDRLHWTFIV